MNETILWAAPFAIIGAVILLPRWRFVLLTLFPLVLFEGALRKWLLPSASSLIYFLKDGLTLLAFIGFLLEGRRESVLQRFASGLGILLLLSSIYLALQIANPNSPNVLVGINGFKSYMLYCALLIMLPHAFSSYAELDRHLRLLMIIMTPIAALGLLQFFLPSDHVLNTYVKADSEAEMFISQFGEARARATGTFSYIGGFGTFVVTAFNLAVAYVLATGQQSRGSWPAYALLFFATLAIFTTGSRSVLLGTLGLLPLPMALAVKSGLLTSRNFIQLAAASVIVTTGVLYFAGEALDATTNRATTADSNVMRLMSPYTELANAFETSPVFGTGIGTNGNGSWVIVGIRTLHEAWWLHGNIFEVETARVMQEVGVIGFLLVYSVRLTLLAWAVVLSVRLRTPLYKALSAVISSFFLLHLGMFVINNPTANVFYWAAAGLLFTMYRLEVGTASAPATYQGSAVRQRAMPQRRI